MSGKRFIGVIPARYASTRFPGKPLVKIGGKMMIQRVYEQVMDTLDEVCVATDDRRIIEAVHSFGGNVIMTSERHKSGTDRCHEAMLKCEGDYDVVVNIQGDEPFIQPQQISLLKACFDNKNTQIATLVKPFTLEDGWEALSNPNSPKVIMNDRMEAIYFSRSVIPYVRNYPEAEWLNHQTFYKHIGLYAYRTDILESITELEQTPLELAESLEQLRWLENGYKINVAVTQFETIGIDTPEDLDKAEKFIQNKR
ncbi:3-deoxy-manno-octulosonate cytidylyltransferase [Parabacteroides sp. FAFU027]|uniref:3-deoxy-manno-octulosonate cytidylyltransferase n=1 Tax=Parabacteroides sp. FAFU027 TaxID=2922715 RepID=UPI001FAF4C91|nr:3-deoxy-manno-octulosonate cytidylyltransferase [Parabacteroides sp. FAFU027]